MMSTESQGPIKSALRESTARISLRDRDEFDPPKYIAVLVSRGQGAQPSGLSDACGCTTDGVVERMLESWSIWSNRAKRSKRISRLYCAAV
jgi:hypothetical protein